MKKKLLCLILVLCMALTCTFVLTACGPDDESGQADPTLYKLTLSSNITLNETQKAGLKAELVYPERDEDEIAELKNAGASQADIDKAGVKQADGTYGFFDADPIYIYVPEVEGYNFVGFYVNGQRIDYMFLDYNPKDGKPDSWWNMPQKDTVVEARYEVLKYSITYVDINGEIKNPTNPTSYDGSKQLDVELADPAEIAGYTFKYWYYREILFDGTENPSTKEVKCTKLPTVGNEGVIHTVGMNGDQPVYGLTLFAEYEETEYDVEFVYDESLTPLTVSYYGESVEIVDGKVSAKYGDVLDVWADVGNLNTWYYNFVGIYIDGQKVPDTDIGGGLYRVCNRTNVTITANTTIEIKVDQIIGPLPANVELQFKMDNPNRTYVYRKVGDEIYYFMNDGYDDIPKYYFKKQSIDEEIKWNCQSYDETEGWTYYDVYEEDDLFSIFDKISCTEIVESPLFYNCAKQGTETICGYECDVYEDDNGRTYYYSPDLKMNLKFEQDSTPKFVLYAINLNVSNLDLPQ